MKSFKAALILSAVSFGLTQTVRADTFTPVHFFPETCNLVESGTAPENKVIFKGEHSGGGNCRARVPVEVFSKRFEHCALGSISVSYHTSPFSCEFGYYDKERKTVFFNSMTNGKVFCGFVCAEKRK